MALEKPDTVKVDADPATPTTIPKSGSTSTLTLIRFYPERERWDFSPWVNRLEALLTFSGSTFEIGSGLPPQFPRGRLPVMCLQDGLKKEIIPDSLFGYNELVKRGVVAELDIGLSLEDVAKSRAVQSLVEEIFLILIKEGWVEQFDTARDKIVLYKLPFPIRQLVGYQAKRNFSKRCQLSGFSRDRPDSEVNELRQTAVDALAIWVGERKHILGGNAPTRADAAVFGFIASVCANPHWLPKLAVSMNAHPNLRTYAEGLRKTWYPDRPSFM